MLSLTRRVPEEIVVIDRETGVHLRHLFEAC